MRSKILLIGGCGYIGSYLYNSLVQSYHVDVCDIQQRGNPAKIPIKYNISYQRLSKNICHKYEVILWFAGHSSVEQSINDPDGALNNNFFDLVEFLKKIKNTTKFIYASSASLYNGFKGKAKETDIQNQRNNPYDLSKFLFDSIIEHYNKNFYGLRMGTVCGYSPNIREELIFNKMCIDSYFIKKIYLSNPSAKRSLLFLSDLTDLVHFAIEKNLKPGFYNAFSINSTIGQIAKNISRFYKSSIILINSFGTYSFNLCNQKIKNTGLKINNKFKSNLIKFTQDMNFDK